MDGSISAISELPSAFSIACRQARSDGELLERCRRILAERLASDRIWLSVTTASETRWFGPAGPGGERGPGGHYAGGDTAIAISTENGLVEQLRPLAYQVGFGLSVVLDLRSVLVDRQLALDDAVFQLRALRQVARLLSSAHSTGESETLVLDFMAEVFFA